MCTATVPVAILDYAHFRFRNLQRNSSYWAIFFSHPQRRQFVPLNSAHTVVVVGFVPVRDIFRVRKIPVHASYAVYQYGFVFVRKKQGLESTSTVPYR